MASSVFSSSPLILLLLLSSLVAAQSAAGPPGPDDRQRQGCLNPNQPVVLDASESPSLSHSSATSLLSAFSPSPPSFRLLAIGASFGPAFPVASSDALALHIAALPALPPSAPAAPRSLTPSDLSLACDPPPQGAAQEYAGKVVLVLRGNCTFVHKALTLQRLGAAAMFVANTEDELLPMGCNDTEIGDVSVTIPCLLLSLSDSFRLLAPLNHSQVVVSAYAPPRSLLDPAEALLWLLAVSILAVASLWAEAVAREECRADKKSLTNCDTEQEQASKPVSDSYDLSMTAAVSFVFLSSGALLLLYFFMSPWLFDLLLFFFCLMAFEALHFCISSALYFWSSDWGCSFLWTTSVPLPCLGPTSAASLLSFSLSLLLVIFWAFLRHAPLAWLSQDLFGACLILTVLQTVRLPNIRVSTVLLTLAFFYDIFWVFLSPYIFHGQSVMIEVASGKHTGGEQLPLVLAVPRMLGPFGGSSILGLGDVVLPGLLVVFSKRFDFQSKRQGWNGYHIWTICGYSAGLLITYAALILMNGHGQPALLYLVPCTLGTVVCLGWRRGDLSALWCQGSRGSSAPQPSHSKRMEDEEALLHSTSDAGPSKPSSADK